MGLLDEELNGITKVLFLTTIAKSFCDDRAERFPRSLVHLHVPLCPSLLLPHPYQPQGEPGHGQDLLLLADPAGQVHSRHRG